MTQQLPLCLVRLEQLVHDSRKTKFATYDEKLNHLIHISQEYYKFIAKNRLYTELLRVRQELYEYDQDVPANRQALSKKRKAATDIDQKTSKKQHFISKQESTNDGGTTDSVDLVVTSDMQLEEPIISNKASSPRVVINRINSAANGSSNSQALPRVSTSRNSVVDGTKYNASLYTAKKKSRTTHNIS